MDLALLKASTDFTALTPAASGAFNPLSLCCTPVVPEKGSLDWTTDPVEIDLVCIPFLPPPFKPVLSTYPTSVPHFSSLSIDAPKRPFSNLVVNLIVPLGLRTRTWIQSGDSKEAETVMTTFLRSQLFPFSWCFPVG